MSSCENYINKFNWIKVKLPNKDGEIYVDLINKLVSLSPVYPLEKSSNFFTNFFSCDSNDFRGIFKNLKDNQSSQISKDVNSAKIMKEKDTDTLPNIHFSSQTKQAKEEKERLLDSHHHSETSNEFTAAKLQDEFINSLFNLGFTSYIQFFNSVFREVYKIEPIYRYNTEPSSNSKKIKCEILVFGRTLVNGKIKDTKAKARKNACKILLQQMVGEETYEKIRAIVKRNKPELNQRKEKEDAPKLPQIGIDNFDVKTLCLDDQRLGTVKNIFTNFHANPVSVRNYNLM